MKAFVPAAGLGTRLMPLTLHRPKALVEAGGMTLLERTVRKLAGEGFDDIIINVHHFADKMKDYIGRLRVPDCRLTISDESVELLDTGGGLKKTEWFFGNEPFLIYNVDVVTHLDLGVLYQKHLASGCLGTLAVSRRQTSRYFLFDAQMLLRGWENMATGERHPADISETGLHPLAFSGIQVLSPEVFSLMPDRERFSLVSLYISLCRSNRICGHDHTGMFWLDMGKPESLRLFNEGKDEA